jgi:hypothetical protein
VNRKDRHKLSWGPRFEWGVRLFRRWVRPLLAVALFGMSLPPVQAREPSTAGTTDPVARDVLRTLLATPLGRALPPLPYKVTELQTYVPNALSNPNGQVYVTLGTTLVLGDQRGLWAGLLSHELGHVLLHHPDSLPGFEHELQQAYLQAYSQGAGSASTPGRRAAWLVAELGRHGRHEEEHEADIIGLMLMAQAGYHPQFFQILGRDFNFYLNTSRVTSFFVAHPDWGSRQKRLLQVYDVALAIFDSRWPDIARSPGGKLPALGSIGNIEASQDTAAKGLLFRVPFRLSNPDHKPVRAALTLLENNKRVPSALPEYRSADGFLVVNSDLSSSISGADEIVLRLPLAAIGTRTRKLKAVVFLATGNQPIAIAQLTVRLPGE